MKSPGSLLVFFISILLFSGNSFSKENLGPYPFYQTQQSGDKEESKNYVQLLNSGIGSFYKRLDMVRRAQEEIIIEYFIYEKDTSGKILLNALIKKAKQGVRVRVLLDKSITIIEVDEYVAKYMKAAGIEVSHYNRALDPLTAQYRTHRKIFAIDRKEAITGGRNIGDDYFDLDPVYNFLDRDIWIKGPIVQSIWDSFDAYWDSSRVKVAKEPSPTHRLSMFHNNRAKERYLRLREKGHKRMLKEARDFVYNMKGIDKKTEDVFALGKSIQEKVPVHICPKITYTSDLPGGNISKNFSKESYRKQMRITRKEIFRRLQSSEETSDEVYLASPYFMLNKEWKKSIDYLLQHNKKVKVYTNSLGSTDAHYVSAVFYRIIFDWQEKGVIPYIHDSKYAGLTGAIDNKVTKTRWGMHSKTHIYDEDSFYIGTYNIDNRSDFYNTEMGIFCDGNAELTAELKSNIDARIKSSYTINGRKTAVDQLGRPADVYGNATKKHIKIMKRYVIPTYFFEPLM